MEETTAKPPGPWTGPFVSFVAAGRVLVVTGGTWVLYCACVLGGTLVLFTGGGANLTSDALLLALLAGFGALLTAILGSFLMSAAAFRLRGTLRELSVAPYLQEKLRPSTVDTVRRTEFAALSFLTYGVLGIVAALGLAFVLTGIDWNPTDALRAVVALAFLDVGASVVLFHAAGQASKALRGVHRNFARVAMAWEVRPPNLLGFAYLNFAGSLAVAVPLLFVAAASSPSAASSAVCLLSLGGILAGIVTPLYGFATFIRLAWFGLALR